MKETDMRRIMARWLWLLLGAAALAACEHKPAAPGEMVRASNEAVQQCSVDTDCMINRVFDGGQCKMRSDTAATVHPSPNTPATPESDHEVGVDPDVAPSPDAADPAYPAGAQAVVGEVQADDTGGLAAEALEQERIRLERERVADEKRRLERERRELERQRKKIAEQRAAEQQAREREEQALARRQAETADALYESRRSDCRKGFFGSACRKRIREQVCAGHWSPNPPDGYSTCKLKQPVVTIEARRM